MARAAVAAGHPETAEAGAWALREGGNAVDAAVAAVCASFAAESPLTGLGAGGYMLVRPPEGGSALLDFFVAAPGKGALERSSELVPVEIDFGDTTQVFHVGAASCGVPGVPAGLAAAVERWGSMQLGELIRPACRLARGGVVTNAQQAFLFELLAPILLLNPEGRQIYAPSGRMPVEGETLRMPDLATGLELLAGEGPTAFYRGEIADAICSTVAAGGGILAPEDLASYQPIAREPIRVGFLGREILTNPPPSSGGILIAFALSVMDRLGDTSLSAYVGAMAEAQASRTTEFHSGLYEPDFGAGFLADDLLQAAHGRVRDRLGSTTHITAVDAQGGCASVTCSNGAGSGVIVPGTGVHLNDMLGEEDLNPFGFHSTPAGRRMPSMMSPTLVLSGGELELALGSAGSNRIRSAITQTILRALSEGRPADEAVAAPRVHFEAGVVHAEPGIDESELAALEAAGYPVNRFSAPNVYFGGVQAIARDPAGGKLSGGGDPRRGGAVVIV